MTQQKTIIELLKEKGLTEERMKTLVKGVPVLFTYINGELKVVMRKPEKKNKTTESIKIGYGRNYKSLLRR